MSKEKKNLESPAMSFGDHLEELRNCLIRCLYVFLISLIIVAIFYQPIFDFFRGPIDTAFERAGVAPSIVSSLMEALVSLVKAVAMAAFTLGPPFILKEVWKFIAPGLNSNEKKFMQKLMSLGTVFFIAGALLAYYFVAPVGLLWLIQLNESLEVTSLIRINESIDFVVMLMFVFGLAFETPLVIIGLVKANIVSIATLKKIRKYILLVSLIIGAVFTPPDIPTQLMLALSLVLLYELGMFFGGLRSPQTNDDSPTNQGND